MSDLYLQHMCQTFRSTHNCEAEYVETVPVVERKKSKTVWKGNVEVFKLKDHPRAKRGYAWVDHKSKASEPVTVLELPPVVSPKTAVRTAMIERHEEQARV